MLKLGFRIAAWIAFCSVPLLPFDAPAQNIASDGDVEYGYNSFHSPDGGADNAVFRIGGPGQADHLFQSWWWLRIEADTAETQLRDPDSVQATSNRLDIAWQNVDGSGRLNAMIEATVSEQPGCAGNVVENLTLINTSSGNLTVHAFAYTDVDLTDSAFDDQAMGVPPSLDVAVYDVASSITIGAAGADAMQVTDTQAEPSLRSLLIDASPTNLNGTGLPFASPPSEDFDAAHQWTRTIAQGASVTITRTLALEAPQSCSEIFRDGFEPRE